MVLAKLYTNLVRAEARAEGWAEGYAEGYAQGLREGEQKMLALWRGWNARRLQAKSAGQPFTEPEPGSELEIGIPTTRK